MTPYIPVSLMNPIIDFTKVVQLDAEVEKVMEGRFAELCPWDDLVSYVVGSDVYRLYAFGHYYNVIHKGHGGSVAYMFKTSYVSEDGVFSRLVPNVREKHLVNIDTTDDYVKKWKLLEFLQDYIWDED